VQHLEEGVNSNGVSFLLSILIESREN